MSESVRRLLMTVAGVLLCGIGAGLMSHAALGLDPFQVFARGLWGLTPLPYGHFYVLLCAAMLLIILLWNRHMIGIGTLLNLFLLGYVLEGSERLAAALFPAPSFAARLLLLAVGIVVLCFSAAIYFTADLGVSTYDAVALTLAERQHRLPFKYLRVLTDLACVLIGYALGFRAGVGIGTLVTAFFMGPLIAFFRRTIAEPLRYGKR